MTRLHAVDDKGAILQRVGCLGTNVNKYQKLVVVRKLRRKEKKGITNNNERKEKKKSTLKGHLPCTLSYYSLSNWAGKLHGFGFPGIDWAVTQPTTASRGMASFMILSFEIFFVVR